MRVEYNKTTIYQNSLATPPATSVSEPPSEIPAIEVSKQYIDFTNNNPTSYHVVDYFTKRLIDKGFTSLNEREPWELEVGKKYFTTRSGSSLIAFVVGDKFAPGHGVGVVAAHIDALTAKLKPISKVSPVEGYTLLGVAPYAGALNWLWWDQDLSLAGRVIVKTPEGKAVPRLLHIKKPIGKIPTLAPHFGSEKSQPPFNKETQTVPIIGLEKGKEKESEIEYVVTPITEKHDPRLLAAIAKELKIEVKDILNFDLELVSSQPGTLGGLEDEFVFAPRIDDRACSFAALEALLETDALDAKEGINAVALFDNEEIGSLSRQGAKGGLIESTIERILHSIGKDATRAETFANSFLLSADVTHAVNPNFADAYSAHYRPKLNVGVAISTDANMRMATDAVGLSFVEEVARKCDSTLQYFQIRNGEPSGGTIGPMLSASTGIRTVEVGIAQLSMHSIRATIGSQDIFLGKKYFKGFFKNWFEIDNNSYSNFA